MAGNKFGGSYGNYGQKTNPFAQYERPQNKVASPSIQKGTGQSVVGGAQGRAQHYTQNFNSRPSAELRPVVQHNSPYPLGNRQVQVQSATQKSQSKTLGSEIEKPVVTPGPVYQTLSLEEKTQKWESERTSILKGKDTAGFALTRLKGVSRELDLLSQSADTENSEPHVKLKALCDQVKEELGLLEDITKQKSGTTPPKNSTWESILAFKKQGCNAEETAKYAKLGLHPSELTKYLELSPKDKQSFSEFAELGFSLEQFTTFTKAGGSHDDALEFRNRKFDAPEEMCLLKSAKLGPSDGQRYREVGVPINKDTIIKNFHPNNLKNPGMKKLGEGLDNIVYKGVYSTPHGDVPMVYKKENTDGSIGTAEELGINEDNPQFGCRNIASYKTAQMLKFDVIPRTEFTIHDNELGIVMELAPGTSILKDERIDLTHEKLGEQFSQADAKQIKALKKQHEFKEVEVDRSTNPITVTGIKVKETKFDISEPTLLREMTKLQLLDGLCAQGDRHARNYFINKNDNGTYSVKGIDNDESFGKNIMKPNGIAYSSNEKSSRHGFRGVRLPPYIDSEMKDSILALKPEDLEREVGELLTPSELDAMKSRLQVMQDAVKKKEQRGRVISPDQWATVKSSRYKSNNSYLTRDLG